MKRALTILGLCLTATALVAVPATSAPTAQTAKKKKKTYCQKVGSNAKAKLKAKSMGFYVFVEPGLSSVLICQDKPKFYGSFGLEAKGDKVSQLRVIKKKCAIFSARGSSHNPQIYAFDFENFKKGNAAQASIYTVGYGQPSAALISSALSPNCVSAYGERVNGAPQITVKGTSAFGYTGQLQAPVGANATDNDLGTVKVTGSGNTATVTWTEGGQPKSYVYQQPGPSY